MKRNEESLQEMRDYVKRLNLCLIVVPEEDRENESKLEKHSSGYYPGELPQHSKAGQHSNTRSTENTTKILLKKSNPKAHNCQIHQGWKEGKNAKGNQKERLSHPQREAHQSHGRSLRRNPTNQKGEGGQYSTSLKKRTFNPEFHVQPNLAS